jgi:hypothetical protein
MKLNQIFSILEGVLHFQGFFLAIPQVMHANGMSRA